MSASKTFTCEHCDLEAKISTKMEDVDTSDFVYCPRCGADIYEEDDE